MTTSANSIEHTIYCNGKETGSFRKNVMCKLPDYAELLKYQPLSDHTILVWGYDEEEAEWCDEEENLEIFLKRMIHSNKKLKEYFSSIKTVGQIIQELEEEGKERTRQVLRRIANEKEKIR